MNRRAVRVRVVHLAAGALLAAGTGALAAAASPGAAAVALAALVPACVYVGAAFVPTAARAHAAILLLGPGIAVATGNAAALWTLWLPLVATLAVTVELLSRHTTGLRRQAGTDPLTGLRNRSGFVEATEPAIATCRRTGAPLTLAHIDLDGFKAVNDRRGHLEGDRILRLCADAWRSELRAGDILARLGGDEFALVLPNADRAAANALLQRLLAASPIPWSYGIAELEPGDDVQGCLVKADAELYAAKALASDGRPAPTRNATGPALREGSACCA